MDAEAVRQLVAESLNSTKLTRLGRSRWVMESPELIWVVEVDRASAWGSWAVRLGAVVRDWAPDRASPHASDGHLYQDYVNHGRGLPPGIESTGPSDHLSYFAMVLDHRHDNVSDAERRTAFAFMADELDLLVSEVRSTSQLATLAVSDRCTGAFVDPRLREVAAQS
jgi:hypothetical protein